MISHVKIVFDHITGFLDPESSCPLPKTSRWRTNNTPQNNWDDLTHQNESPADSEEDEEEFYDSIDEIDHGEDEWSDTQGEFDSTMDDTAETNSDSNSQFEKSGAPLYTGSEITIAQAMVLILSFSLRHSLTASAVEDLLKLLNVFLPSSNILPESLHLFRKIFHNPSESLNVHLFCNICQTYLSKNNMHCPECNEINDPKKNIAEGNFYISLSIEDQLRDILQKDDSAFESEEYGINDVRKGEMYQTLPNFTVNDISLLWNCDGIPMFKSSAFSLWPIRCVINELQPNVRFKNMILAGVWFGRGKPDMSTYLKQFVDDILKINSKGLEWRHPHSKRTVVSKVFPIVCSCDAVARCMLQCIHQFNGAYGCGHCLNEGKTVPKGRGYARVYPPTEGQKRTHDHVIECGQRAIENDVDHVFGVKSVSPLVLLNPSTGFDIVNSFPIDYMHCVLLGVTKQFLDLWFNSKYHDSPWYIGTSHKLVDQRLLTIKPPSDIPRIPRTVKVAQRWKAAECRSWLLFYSGPVLYKILPTKMLKHWLLLVTAIFCFLKDTVTENDLAAATSKITKFVQEIPTIYGLCQMSFNVHQLTHLPFSVKMYGPLWCTSAFSFEGHNQKLKRLCHGTNSIPSQIARQFNILQSIPQLLKETTTSADVSNRVAKLVNDWLGVYPLVAKAQKLESLVLLGCSRQKMLDHKEKFLMLPVCDLSESDEYSAETYERAIVNGQLLTTEKYGKEYKHNSFTVQLQNGCIGKIESIVNIHDHKNNPLIQVQLLQTTLAGFVSEGPPSHIKEVMPTPTRMIVKPMEIVRKVVHICLKNTCYIALQPNSIELD